MDLKQIEYFVRVAELGSFTKAASVLNIAQPALSRQIRQLEIEFHQNLLIRNGRGVVMTEIGRVFLEHCRGILHQVSRAKEDMDRARGTVLGRVALGLPPSLARILTVGITREFRALMPSVNLSISEGLSITLLDWLVAGRIDIAALYNPSYSPEVEAVDVLEEDLYLIGKPHNGFDRQEITLKELAHLPLIMPARPNSVRMLFETALAKIHKKPQIEIEIDGISAILDLAEEGVGYAVLPNYALGMNTQRNALKLYRISDLKSRLCLAFPANRPKTIGQQAMMSLLQGIIKTKL